MFNLKNEEACYLDFNFFFLKEYQIEKGRDMSQEQLTEAFINSAVFGKTITIKEFPIENIEKVAHL